MHVDFINVFVSICAWHTAMGALKIYPPMIGTMF